MMPHPAAIRRNPLAPATLPELSGMALRQLHLPGLYRMNAISKDVCHGSTIVSTSAILSAIRENKSLCLDLLLTTHEPYQYQMDKGFAEMHRLAIVRTIATLEERLIAQQITILEKHYRECPPTTSFISFESLNAELAEALKQQLSPTSTAVHDSIHCIYKRYLSQCLSNVTRLHKTSLSDEECTLETIDQMAERHITLFLEQFRLAGALVFREAITADEVKLVIATLQERRHAVLRRYHDAETMYMTIIEQVGTLHQNNNARLNDLITFGTCLTTEAPEELRHQLEGAGIHKSNADFIQKLSAALSQRQFMPLEIIPCEGKSYLYYAVEQGRKEIIDLFLEDCIRQELNPLQFKEDSGFRSSVTLEKNNILHLLAMMASAPDVGRENIQLICSILKAVLDAAIAVIHKKNADSTTKAIENAVQQMLSEVLFEKNSAGKTPIALYLESNKFHLYALLRQYVQPKLIAPCPLEKAVYERLNVYDARLTQLEEQKEGAGDYQNDKQRFNDEPVTKALSSRMLHQRKLIEQLWIGLWSSNVYRQESILTTRIRYGAMYHSYIDPLAADIENDVEKNRLMEMLKTLNQAYMEGKILGHPTLTHSEAVLPADDEILLRTNAVSPFLPEYGAFKVSALETAFKVQNILSGKEPDQIEGHLGIPMMDKKVFHDSFHRMLCDAVLVPAAPIVQRSWLFHAVRDRYSRQEFTLLQRYISRFNRVLTLIEEELTPLMGQAESNYALQLDLINIALCMALKRMCAHLSRRQTKAKDLIAHIEAAAYIPMPEPIKQTGDDRLEIAACSSSTIKIYEKLDKYKKELKRADDIIKRERADAGKADRRVNAANKRAEDSDKRAEDSDKRAEVAEGRTKITEEKLEQTRGYASQALLLVRSLVSSGAHLNQEQSTILGALNSILAIKADGAPPTEDEEEEYADHTSASMVESQERSHEKAASDTIIASAAALGQHGLYAEGKSAIEPGFEHKPTLPIPSTV